MRRSKNVLKLGQDWDQSKNIPAIRSLTSKNRIRHSSSRHKQVVSKHYKTAPSSTKNSKDWETTTQRTWGNRKSIRIGTKKKIPQWDIKVREEQKINTTKSEAQTWKRWAKTNTQEQTTKYARTPTRQQLPPRDQRETTNNKKGRTERQKDRETREPKTYEQSKERQRDTADRDKTHVHANH